MTLPTQQQLQEQLEDALNSVLCFCGNHKRIAKPFCFQCWDSLPQDWKLILQGSTTRLHINCAPPAHTYDAAKEWLIAQRKLPRIARKASETDSRA